MLHSCQVDGRKWILLHRKFLVRFCCSSEVRKLEPANAALLLGRLKPLTEVNLRSQNLSPGLKHPKVLWAEVQQ